MADASFWNLRLNLDKLNGLNNRCRTDAERLLVFQGFLAGCNGAEALEDDPPAFRRGWDLGSESHEEAKRYHQAQSERGRASAAKRLERTGSAQPQKPTADRAETEPPIEPPFEPRFEPPLEPNLNPQSSIQETTTDKQRPPTPQGGERSAKMIPPTEQEWVAYCTDTWPDWHPTCAAESWAYYKSKGWKIGSAPCRDWKAAAKTAHGNARNWGKLQPVVPGRAGPPGRQPVQWTGFDRTNYDQAKDQCRKDEHGNFLL